MNINCEAYMISNNEKNMINACSGKQLLEQKLIITLTCVQHHVNRNQYNTCSSSEK
jgi:hypothetical protein